MVDTNALSLLQLIKRLIPGLLVAMLVFATGCEADKKEIPSPGIYLKMPDGGFELEVNDTLIITPKITYDYQSTYQWYLNGELLTQEPAIVHVSKVLGKETYSFVVETPSGKDSLVIPVSTILRIDFKELELANNSYNRGENLPGGSIGFISKGLVFPVNPFGESEWTGFTLSSRFSQTTTAQPDLYSAYATRSTSGKFMLYSQPLSPYAASVYLENGQNRVFGSMSVANSTLTYLVMRHGTESGIRRFGGTSNNEPDWFRLTIEGYTNDGVNTGKVEYYLADFRSANNRLRTMLANWATIDLTPLGEINRLSFTLNSSIKNEEGQMLTPPFFCIDNIKIIR
ncbi:DUF4465 domain-containing protein [Alkaliflexus imshenetskii]|uniref:DUF4465 domain-containing protein n=1 Tax=Alkaliflexus imshenetskii TaxID=286730 RepID=UPI000478699B|nr:DUF4465 domain-containing protein [Alkaliflexus imshenetskii]